MRWLVAVREGVVVPAVAVEPGGRVGDEFRLRQVGVGCEAFGSGEDRVEAGAVGGALPGAECGSLADVAWVGVPEVLEGGRVGPFAGAGFGLVLGGRVSAARQAPLRGFGGVYPVRDTCI